MTRSSWRRSSWPCVGGWGRGHGRMGVRSKVLHHRQNQMSHPCIWASWANRRRSPTLVPALSPLCAHLEQEHVLGSVAAVDGQLAGPLLGGDHVQLQQCREKGSTGVTPGWDSRAWMQGKPCASVVAAPLRPPSSQADHQYCTLSEGETPTAHLRREGGDGDQRLPGDVGAGHSQLQALAGRRQGQVGR